MKENNSQKTRPAIRMEEKDAFTCNNLQMLPDSPDPLFAGKGIGSGCKGINSRKLVGNGNPLQYSCLESSIDRGAWWATVHGVTKSRHD